MNCWGVRARRVPLQCCAGLKSPPPPHLNDCSLPSWPSRRRRSHHQSRPFPAARSTATASSLTHRLTRNGPAYLICKWRRHPSNDCAPPSSSVARFPTGFGCSMRVITDGLVFFEQLLLLSLLLAAAAGCRWNWTFFWRGNRKESKFPSWLL